MAEEDYYTILGVSRDADQDMIRRAYRERVKRYHPDWHPGNGSKEERFKQLQRAYETLSDPEQRAQYDARLLRSQPRYRVETILERPGSYRTFIEEADVLFRSLDTLLSDSSLSGRASHDLGMEILLTPEEAARGGRLPLQIPVIQGCPACGGMGGSTFHLCGRCGGFGRIETDMELDVQIPAGVQDYEVAQLSVYPPFGEPVSVRITFRVG